MADSFFDRPPSFQINAWTGSDSAPALVTGDRVAWSLHSRSPGKADGERERDFDVDIRDWTHPKVGWGLVLPDNEEIRPAGRRARADDAPEAIQRLLASRPGAPVLRWRANASGFGELLRYTPDDRVRTLQLTSAWGVALDRLPRFLLIFAPPSVVPWSFQYAANLQRGVGRLWLEGEALDNYVNALIGDWAGAACDSNAPLVWSVDHGKADITWLMDQAISRKLSARWSSEPDGDFSRATRLFGADATREQLVEALSRTKPGLVVTTSHGMTGPLNDAATMAAQLGMPVDATRRSLDLAALCDQWQPDGAIWYSHACCSAGSDAVSAYDGLFDRSTDVGRVLAGVSANCGASIAPLPQRLLGAKRPLRAFIGHVEPTFDWTLRDPETQQRLTDSLLDALHDKLFSRHIRPPIGSAMASVFDGVGTLLSQWGSACGAANRGAPNSLIRALHFQVSALDRQHTVILGDPTAALPALAALAAAR